MSKFITPTEYAKKKGITLSAVTKKLRAGIKPNGVKSFKKYGRFYLLEYEGKNS